MKTVPTREYGAVLSTALEIAPPSPQLTVTCLTPLASVELSVRLAAQVLGLMMLAQAVPPAAGGASSAKTRMAFVTDPSLTPYSSTVSSTS